MSRTVIAWRVKPTPLAAGPSIGEGVLGSFETLQAIVIDERTSEGCHVLTLWVRAFNRKCRLQEPKSPRCGNFRRDPAAPSGNGKRQEADVIAAPAGMLDRRTLSAAGVALADRSMRLRPSG
jgi:hypothetical protein